MQKASRRPQTILHRNSKLKRSTACLIRTKKKKKCSICNKCSKHETASSRSCRGRSNEILPRHFARTCRERGELAAAFADGMTFSHLPQRFLSKRCCTCWRCVFSFAVTPPPFLLCHRYRFIFCCYCCGSGYAMLSRNCFSVSCYLNFEYFANENLLWHLARICREGRDLAAKAGGVLPLPQIELAPAAHCTYVAF